MSRVTKRSREEVGEHPKRWGSEFWVENCPEYCGKVLCFDGPGATSMHFHVRKLETMLLLQGNVVIDMIDTDDGTPYSIELVPGDAVQIPRFQPHSIRALDQASVVEFSTTHFEDDSFRLSKAKG